jgi:hypothetical protein
LPTGKLSPASVPIPEELAAPAGGSGVGKTKRGKDSKWMVVVDGQGIPLGGTMPTASPTEVKLVKEALETINRLLKN